jgi:hypothetical protein
MEIDPQKFVIVPYDRMEELLQRLCSIEKSLHQNKSNSGGLGDYISEHEAKKILAKQTTWFWNKRLSGELTGKKAGNTWSYKQNDILKFIENGKTQTK